MAIDSNSADLVGQKRYLPSSEFLQQIAEGNTYDDVYDDDNEPIKESKRDENSKGPSNSKKNMYIRNTRLFTKSPLEKDIFYTRNTRSPEPEWFLRNTRRESVATKSKKKRAFY